MKRQEPGLVGADLCVCPWRGRIQARILFLFFFLFLTACNEITLLEDLDQHNVNEILVVLSKNGIEAKKIAVQKQQEVSWSIQVSRSDQDRARELLVLNNLPREREMGLSGICKEAGLIPTPKTEKCREMLALKGEIINSLQSIPGVVSADVVLNIPDKEDFPNANEPAKRPTASVVVQMGEKSAPGSLTESKIQQFVSNSVNGMDMRDVAVIISRAGGGMEPGENDAQVVPSIPSAPDAAAPVVAEGQTNPETGLAVAEVAQNDDVAPEESDLVSVGGFKMDPTSSEKFRVLVILFLVFFIILSGALVFVLLKMARLREKSPFSSPLSPQALPEKTQMDQLVEETGRAGQGQPPGA